MANFANLKNFQFVTSFSFSYGNILENSKNQRKIGFLSFEQGFEFFANRILTQNDS